jgi:CRISPR system Cascade subunit CasC
MTRTIIDFHILQTVPPSNINRDDTGSPKTAFYGGVRRARVSSQAWKRATRKAFGELLDDSALGVRTRKIVELIAANIARQAPDLSEKSDALAEEVLATAGIKVEKPKKGSEPEASAEVAYLLFLSKRQIENLAELAILAERSGEKLEKNVVKKAADANHSIDISLFGRMVAEATDLNVDASAQVAHAISIHAVDNEYDYFTAVDDRAPEDNAGASMIGTVEFNSSTLYRYATVDVDALNRNLGDTGASAKALGAFARAFITSMPTGKQNTFANRTLPDGVVVTVRETQPVNLVGAFENPVLVEGGMTRVAEASSRLVDYSREIDRAYSQVPVASFVLRVGTQAAALEALGQSVDIDGLVRSLESLVTDRLQVKP